jgi:hypothetical protein
MKAVARDQLPVLLKTRRYPREKKMTDPQKNGNKIRERKIGINMTKVVALPAKTFNVPTCRHQCY